MQPLTRIRRPGALAATVASLALLSGCGAGFDATSRTPYAPADGIVANSETVRLLNVLVVADEGADSGVVVATVANRSGQDDRLIAVESPSGTVDVAGGIDVPAQGAVSLGFGDAAEQVTITGLDREPGQAVQLEFVFERSEPIQLRTVVVPPTGYYEGITPAASVSPPSP